MEHSARPSITRAPAAWPADWAEAYEERAAVMEYEGRLPRAEAEHLAHDDILRRFAATCSASPASAVPSSEGGVVVQEIQP